MGEDATGEDGLRQGYIQRESSMMAVLWPEYVKVEAAVPCDQILPLRKSVVFSGVMGCQYGRSARAGVGPSGCLILFVTHL
jgi:hypothetical protein